MNSKRQFRSYFAFTAICVAAAGLLPLASLPARAQQAAVAIDNDDIAAWYQVRTGRRRASG